MENGITSFIRKAFDENSSLTVGSLCEMAYSNRDHITGFSEEYKHRIRSTIYQMVKSGELRKVSKNLYAKT